MKDLPLPRSYLFVPGDRPDRFQKALESGTDSVILDLEDAVAPDRRALARTSIAEWLTASLPVLVRINAVGTTDFADDLALCAQLPCVGVVLSKAESAADVDTVVRATGKPVLPLIESARGVLGLAAIAAAEGVERLVFGALDFQFDLKCSPTETELLPIRWRLLLESRAAGIDPPVDSITSSLNDPDRLHQDASRAYRLGFSGKLCIHPSQVGSVNGAFLPGEEDIAWARKVISATKAGEAVRLEGELIDRPVLMRARQILAQVDS